MKTTPGSSLIEDFGRLEINMVIMSVVEFEVIMIMVLVKIMRKVMVIVMINNDVNVGGT